MANPATRVQLKEYCLRRLGHPVIEINIDEDQMQDRIDDALEYYRDYHYDGAQKVYLKHQITATDITNEYVAIPAAVTAVVGIFDVGDAINGSNLFNVRYQIHLNDLFDFTSSSYAPYVSAMRHVETLEELFVGKQPIRFNRHMDRLFIDMDWSEDLSVGDYIIIEAYRYLDTATYTSVWGDQWLRQYTTQLFKRQWGENMKKFEGMQLPGGVTFNGQTIWQEATEEIQRLEEQVMTNFALPPMDMIG
jgi:hypothetical protein